MLLNQVGTTPTEFLGYGNPGFNVTLSDAGTANLHLYQQQNPSFNTAGQLLGTWQPDSANTLNGTFGGLTANGTWTLYLADVMRGAGAARCRLGAWKSVWPRPPVPEGGRGIAAAWRCCWSWPPTPGAAGSGPLTPFA